MAEYKILKFIRFWELEKWDIKRFFLNKVSSKYPIFSLSELLQEQNKKKKLYDFPDEDFGILGVSNSNGMFDAYTEKGKNINQPYKIVHDDYIAYNPYRVNVGSVGIKKDNLKNTYISSAYVVFSTKEKLSPDYLYLLMHTKEFNKQIKDHTTGSVRQTLSFENLCNIFIPTPPLSTQEKLVKDYDSAMQKVTSLEKQAQEVQNRLEEYIAQTLRIKKQEKKEKQEGLLRFVQFCDIADRWDLWNEQGKIECKYPMVKVCDFLNCVNRSWKKKTEKNEFFEYIEIGGIDSDTNEIASEKVETQKAPSRATQIVHTGDLLFGLTRPYLKKFAIVDELHNNCICSSGFQVIEPSKKYDLKYILELFKMNICISQFNEAMTGALYPALNSRQFDDVFIPLPPLCVQKEIASYAQSQKEKAKQLAQEAVTLKKKALDDFCSGVFE